jgi:hypothetical protein
MKICFPLLIISFMISFEVSGQQTNEEIAIKEVISQLFKGMEKGDSAMVRNVFAKNITMATAFRDKNNNPVLRQESSLDGFLKAVGTPHKEVLHEEIWNLKTQVDDDLAQVWCDYAFYVDKNFSHCGVDAFHLHKTKEGWKIFHLADTRRKQGCDIPLDIQNKYK